MCWKQWRLTQQQLTTESVTWSVQPELFRMGSATNMTEQNHLQRAISRSPTTTLAERGWSTHPTKLTLWSSSCLKTWLMCAVLLALFFRIISGWRSKSFVGIEDRIQLVWGKALYSISYLAIRVTRSEGATDTVNTRALGCRVSFVKYSHFSLS